MLGIGMLVTLRTLHLPTQEDSRRHRRGGDGLVVQMSEEEIRLADFVTVSLGRNQFGDCFGPGAIVVELMAEKFRQGFTIDRAFVRPPHQQVDPHGGQIASVVRRLEQRLHHQTPLVGAVVTQKAIQAGPIGDMPHQIEIHASQPLRVIGHGRRLNTGLFPLHLEQSIDP